ncbi:MAG: EAL domain-containing protein [Pseudomonas gingeri]
MPDIQDLSQVFIQTLEQSIDSVVVIDSQNRVILFNAAAEALWGYSREEVIGQNVSILVPQLIRAEHDGYIDANRRSGLNKIVGTSRDVLIERKDGARRWGAMSISKLKSDGQLMYTAFIKDITVQHEERERLYLLSLVVDSTENAIIVTDAQWQIRYVNGGFTEMFGYDEAAVVGRTPISLIAPYFEVGDIAAIRAQLGRGEAYHSQEFGYRHDGRRVWCNVTTYPVLDSLGHLTHTVSVLIDVTHSRMPEVLRHKVLEAMVREESLAALMMLVCREVERIAPDVIASILRVDEGGTLHPLAAPSLPEHYSNALDGLRIGPQVGSCGTAAFSGEPVVVADIAHHPFWEGFRDKVIPLGLKACWSTPIKSSSGRVLGTFAFYYRERREPSPLDQLLVNATIHLCALALEREESRAHIRQLAFYDDLTGLPNRNMLHAKADQAIADSVRSKSSLAVVFIDLDRFKQVNDSLGHAAGDEFLCMIARRLQERRRKQDIVCRLSGDEFVLVLPQCSLEQVTDLLVSLKSCLSVPCQIAGVTLKPSASIGVSMFPEDGRTMEVLLQRADIAMYQAKTSARGSVSFFSHGLDQMAKGRLSLETALREAIDRKQLHLVYQPQVDLNHQDLCGIEALARWSHPQFGEVSPCTFIPMAEECGLIGEFGQWSVREACRQLASWRRQHLKVPSISVNLSPTNFHNRDLPRFISRALSQNGLVAADLTVEITESVLMDNNPDTLCTIDEIHALGVRLAMDDFGTGYSSLSYLRRLPIQELKLDRSFVHDLETDETSQALSEAVIRIGESLELRVVAEGVETLAQQRILQAQGYEVAQGFLISKPMRAAELGAWLESFRLNA